MTAYAKSGYFKKIAAERLTRGRCRLTSEGQPLDNETVLCRLPRCYLRGSGGGPGVLTPPSPQVGG